MKLKLNIYWRIFGIISLIFSTYCIYFSDYKYLKIIGMIILIINLIIPTYLFEKQKRENQS